MYNDNNYNENENRENTFEENVPNEPVFDDARREYEETSYIDVPYSEADTDSVVQDDGIDTEGESTPNVYTLPEGSGSSYSDTHIPPAPEAPKVRRGDKPVTMRKLVAACLICSLLGGVVGAGGLYGLNRFVRFRGSTVMFEGDRPSSVINTSAIDTSKIMTAAEVYAKNVASTVGIKTEVMTNYFGYTTKNSAAGSGFVLTADGYIVTNYHVVEGSNSITVTTYDNKSYDAVIVGYDESEDLAVLKIEAEGLIPVILGDSGNLNVGDTVAAIGNPLGELTFSQTTGTVSALNRKVTFSNGTTMDLIQTDCAINSGNSGGALFNMYGEVIGITNAKYSSSSSGASVDNIGFAIPISNVKDLITSIIEKGYVTKPYVGVSVSDMTQESLDYGLPKGAAVKTIVEGGPADKAGLQVNDIITKADGKEITGKDDVVSYVADRNVGDKIVFTVYRQGQYMDITVTVGERIKSATEDKEDNQQQSQQSQQQSQQSQQGGSYNPFDFFFGN